MHRFLANSEKVSVLSKRCIISLITVTRMWLGFCDLCREHLLLNINSLEELMISLKAQGSYSKTYKFMLNHSKNANYNWFLIKKMGE